MSDSHTISQSLVHHSAAANSNHQIVCWLPDNRLVYASHSILNIVDCDTWRIQETLRTCVVENSILCRSDPNEPLPVITALFCINTTALLVCGFSNGCVSLWSNNNGNTWSEQVLVAPDGIVRRSITAISGICHANRVWIVTGTSSGAVLYKCDDSAGEPLESWTLTDSPVFTLSCQVLSEASCMVLVGTAAPRHNKIQIHRVEENRHFYAGSLLGHEDWISCFDWKPSTAAITNSTALPSYLLASGSQDAKIRLWLFRTKEGAAANDEGPAVADNANSSDDDDDDVDDDDDELHNDQGGEEDEEGESRLEIVLDQDTVLSVTLDALLLGHEESITSVVWHTNALATYGVHDVLISASMDRAILFWAPADDEGIWTPITRVGSAGGIVGGSVGSTLLGYLNATIDPATGRHLVGHAYGGSLHVWTQEDQRAIAPGEDENDPARDGTLVTVEERAALVYWKATQCVTGHYDAVTDLCWEARSGQYLLTVSDDQTCRLWAPVAMKGYSNQWMELARPQVHGYNLSAVASLSTSSHPHLMITGADEKELRVFDAPKTTIRMLQAVGGGEDENEDTVERIDRAFIPSLGLSNKASANEGAEEADSNADRYATAASSEGPVRLPLERDLGVVSLWPEIRKLFGHNTELYCLATNARVLERNMLLVASSAKARDVDAAAIRLWDVQTGKCLQVLSGGHKATVATLAFSSTGEYLCSSGKDRRLCIWKRNGDNPPNYSLAWAKDVAHKRIIWSVDFLSTADGQTILASGSRDGSVKIWNVAQEIGGRVEASEVCSFVSSFVFQNQKPDAVTALAFAPLLKSGPTILALGLGSGRIELWRLESCTLQATLLTRVKESSCHNAGVTRLSWRPNTSSPLQLASCSHDRGCRIHQFQLSSSSA